ncbi:Increased loss of mitochondrial DNA protein 1 [Geosmithia morbida]|uniref:Increased loss of mitochondrial DNA protein 1 n=1 Tax=Geosmithia morbida TaxID=1094350 RepID=A0A9P4Z1K5_9HYPO|nr:Increased loss of mitochondrial DNA protein 1 [Geosmithia morbida]KAF4127011.1 Increased loss of mitochondrial DNA protein 1 [Geosmithia morbida]
MALISSTTIITSISLFHLTLAYFFLVNPRTIDDQVLVWVMGESMGMPIARGLDTQSPALGILSIILAMLGLSDLVSLSMPEEVALIYYWGAQAPLRALFSMAILFYVYMFGPSSPIYQSESPRGPLTAPSGYNPSYVPAKWGGDVLKNRVVFALMFVEMSSWFWAWMTLREDRYALVQRMRAAEDKEN